jgi:hypothetical protein
VDHNWTMKVALILETIRLAKCRLGRRGIYRRYIPRTTYRPMALLT